MSLRSNPGESAGESPSTRNDGEEPRPGRGGSRRPLRRDGGRRPEPRERRPRRDPFDLPEWVADLDAERPYLSALPAGVAGESLVLDWMAFLRGRAGVEGAQEALAYYRSVGWISEAVEEALGDYAAGIETTASTDAGLGVEAHRRSLLFVARLSVTRD